MTLEQNLREFSPRYSARKVPLLSMVVYAFVLALWFTAVAGSWLFSGVFAWTAGLVYVAYDTWLLVHVARKTAYILGPVASAPGPVDRRPTLAVIIAARNEVDALPATLDALRSQTDPPDEIIVADDGSTDATAEMLASRYRLSTEGVVDAQLPTRPDTRLRLLTLPAGGKARALNAAVALTSADIVVTVDADTRLEPLAVAGIRNAFGAEAALVAACGVLTPTCRAGASGALFQWFQTYEYVRAFISRLAWMRSEALLLVSGAFAAFRRDALVTVGGFDADCLVEDYEVIHRLHRYAYERGADWTVRVLGTARGSTEAPGTLLSFLRQRRRWFAGFLQTQYWNRDMTANRRYGSLGRLMLPIKAVDTLQPIYGLTAFVLLVTFAVTANLHVLVPVLTVILVKVVIDLLFYLWWVRLYSRWLGERLTGQRLAMAALAALAEPFSFQLLRHTGAAWGWLAFLSGRVVWGHPTSTVEAAARKAG